MRKLIDGVDVAYDDRGTGATALVLLHGFPYDRTIWEPVFAGLARRVRVIRIDLRGSGESGCGVGPALMETLAGDVFGILDALDVERVVLAGHSLGGYVALAYFRMYAERVAGLALITSVVGADSPERARERDAQAAAVDAEGVQALQAIVDRSFAPVFALANPAVVEHVRAIVARQNPAGAAAQIIGMKERLDSADLLADIAVPTLVVAGGSDPLVVPALAARTAEALSDCELVVLPDVAHLPMFEAPGGLTTALERLVERVRLREGASRQSVRANHA